MQYPIFYKQKYLTGDTYIMLASETTAITVCILSSINGCYINKTDYLKRETLNEIMEKGQQVSKDEFMTALSDALMKIKFTAHGMNDAIETVKQSLSKVG